MDSFALQKARNPYKPPPPAAPDTGRASFNPYAQRNRSSSPPPAPSDPAGSWHTSLWPFNGGLLSEVKEDGSADDGPVEASVLEGWLQTLSAQAAALDLSALVELRVRFGICALIPPLTPTPSMSEGVNIDQVERGAPGAGVRFPRVNLRPSVGGGGAAKPEGRKRIFKERARRGVNSGG